MVRPALRAARRGPGCFGEAGSVRSAVALRAGSAVYGLLRRGRSRGRCPAGRLGGVRVASAWPESVRAVRGAVTLRAGSAGSGCFGVAGVGAVGAGGRGGVSPRLGAFERSRSYPVVARSSCGDTPPRPPSPWPRSTAVAGGGVGARRRVPAVGWGHVGGSPQDEARPPGTAARCPHAPSRGDPPAGHHPTPGHGKHPDRARAVHRRAPRRAPASTPTGPRLTPPSTPQGTGTTPHRDTGKHPDGPGRTPPSTPQGTGTAPHRDTGKHPDGPGPHTAEHPAGDGHQPTPAHRQPRAEASRTPPSTPQGVGAADGDMHGGIGRATLFTGLGDGSRDERSAL